MVTQALHRARFAHVYELWPLLSDAFIRDGVPLGQQTLNESGSLPVDERQPCPNCGSFTRRYKITVVETPILLAWPRR